jgi:hypothetical protein
VTNATKGSSSSDAAKPAQPDAAKPPEPDWWDATGAWIAKHGALPALGIITIAVAIIHFGVFHGESKGDDLTFHFAESARLADCIRAGDFDMWNPSANAGYASAYYYQVIPQLASALPAAVFGHHLFWFELSVWLPLVAAPVCAYRGIRLMGATPWQAVVAAFCVSFTIGQSRWGFASDGTFSVGLYTQTWALAAFPLALGHAVRWATERKGLAPAVAWGGFVGLCHPFAVIALGFALLFGFLGRAIWLVAGTVLDRSPYLASHPRLADVLRVPLFAAMFVFNGLVPLGLVIRILWLVIRRMFGRPLDLAARPVLREFLRLSVYAGLLAITLLPILLPLVIDYSGFGGFPHRVDDEVGPGFKVLGSWYVKGQILDAGRTTVLTWALPIVLLFARDKFLRWLWAPALVFAVLLGLGPHMGKTGDDLIPPVRFLGAMQIVVALGIGAGGFAIGRSLWNAEDRTMRWWVARIGLYASAIALGLAIAVNWWLQPDTWWGFRMLRWGTLNRIDDPTILRVLGSAVWVGLVAVFVRPGWRALGDPFGIRTGIAVAISAVVMAVAAGGASMLSGRVHVLADYPGSHRDEMMTVIDRFQHEPQGRKQVGPGCENHWWNLLSYEYARRPSLLQMGGGGLQASPNYDFLWTSRDFTKNAWLFDAPYLVFQRSSAGTMPVGDVVVQTATYEVRKLPSPGLVSPVQVTGVLPAGRKPAHEAALGWLKTDLPLEDRVLAYDHDGRPGDPPAGKTLRAFRQDSPGDEADIIAEVEVDKPTTFMARESWHPRWHAYIDGAEVAVRRVTPDFPAIDVPTGHHVLAFRFERPWWAHVSWLAWPGMALAAWLATRRFERRRRGVPEPA